MILKVRVYLCAYYIMLIHEVLFMLVTITVRMVVATLGEVFVCF